MQRQLRFEKVNGWGGKRRGAGRKNISNQVNHEKRERVNFKRPLHVTMKLRAGMPSLRSHERMEEFRYAIARAKEFGLHVIHFALESNHIHMIVEACDNEALANGMKSLCGRFGKIIRRAIGGSGAVFAGRYHLHVLKFPREMRHALEYVLLNHSKHRKFVEYIDEFSSGFHFREWKELIGRRFRGLIHEQITNLRVVIEELSEPRSWLAREGWRRAGKI